MIYEKQVSTIGMTTSKLRPAKNLDNVLAALDSTIRSETAATMQARVRYTRVVRELRRLEREHSTKNSVSFISLNQQYLLERRVSRHLSYLELQLARTLARRQRLKSSPEVYSDSRMEELQTLDD